jgi:hypothetical protein
VDADDEEAGENLSFKEVGQEMDFKSTRFGTAKVMLDDQTIGSIYFTLINRNFVGGQYTSFAMACDSVSGILETVANSCFDREDGRLKPSFLSQLNCSDKHASSNHGTFMYISEIELQAPYDRHCDENNVHIATTAIRKLINSTTLTNIEGVHTTLVIYNPDTPNDVLDERPFRQAGFIPVPDRSRTFKHLVYEVYEY